MTLPLLDIVEPILTLPFAPVAILHAAAFTAVSPTSAAAVPISRMSSSAALRVGSRSTPHMALDDYGVPYVLMMLKFVVLHIKTLNTKRTD